MYNITDVGKESGRKIRCGERKWRNGGRKVIDTTALWRYIPV